MSCFFRLNTVSGNALNLSVTGGRRGGGGGGGGRTGGGGHVGQFWTDLTTNPWAPGTKVTLAFRGRDGDVLETYSLPMTSWCLTICLEWITGQHYQKSPKPNEVSAGEHADWEQHYPKSPKPIEVSVGEHGYCYWEQHSVLVEVV